MSAGEGWAELFLWCVAAVAAVVCVGGVVGVVTSRRTWVFVPASLASGVTLWGFGLAVAEATAPSSIVVLVGMPVAAGWAAAVIVGVLLRRRPPDGSSSD